MARTLSDDWKIEIAQNRLHDGTLVVTVRARGSVVDPEGGPPCERRPRTAQATLAYSGSQTLDELKTAAIAALKTDGGVS